MSKQKSKKQNKSSGKPIENQDDIPLEGSLGLLAAGYKGIMLWRNKRKEHLHQVLEERMKEDPKTIN